MAALRGYAAFSDDLRELRRQGLGWFCYRAAEGSLDTALRRLGQDHLLQR
ncbi:hypothetical protein JHW45_16745 [Paracoccus stylophorae]|uniref:Uncharacterized protein n=1 Tax=Paracoccus stylophorae TaxID=659350 RepID=A0ABY7SW98_9RHOB|nr:hypothetical protein [Paracoccus stylophorae]WCR10662.1 hypothetical protein JHW45_16745 [Paracoccus stylophorae]